GGYRSEYFGNHQWPQGPYQGRLVPVQRNSVLLGLLVFQNIDVDGVLPYILQVVHIVLPPVLEKFSVPGLEFNHVDLSVSIAADGQATGGAYPSVVGIVPPKGNAFPGGQVEVPKFEPFIFEDQPIA